eukprot:78177_1
MQKSLHDQLRLETDSMMVPVQPDKNYLFLNRKPSNDETTHMEYIKSMEEYSKRCYARNQIGKSVNIPFPIIFIVNLLIKYPSTVIAECDQYKEDTFSSSLFRRYVSKYVRDYFLQHYEPDSIPLLYAMILCFHAKSLQTISFYGNSTKYKNKRIKYHELSITYYYKHCKNKYDYKLTNTFIQWLEICNLTMVKSSFLNQTTIIAIDNALKLNGKQKLYKNGTRLLDESFKHYIVNHNKYSIYDRDGEDFCYAGFEFVCEMTRRCIIYATPSKYIIKYQKRYKYLLKIAIKSYKKIINEKNEKYGLYHAYIGYYYALYSKKKNHLLLSRKYLYKGIGIIRNIDKYKQTLTELYVFLIWIERALCDLDGCINVLKMSIELNEYYNLTNELKVDRIELQTVQRDKKMGIKYAKKISKEYGLYFWNWHLKKSGNRRKNHKIWKNIFKWNYYYKDLKSYNVLKNICMMKECNYSKCRKKNIKLKKCCKCKSVYYCCITHQKIDWNIKHRKQCQLLNERNLTFTLRNRQNRWESSAYFLERGYFLERVV